MIELDVISEEGTDNLHVSYRSLHCVAQMGSDLIREFEFITSLFKDETLQDYVGRVLGNDDQGSIFIVAKRQELDVDRQLASVKGPIMETSGFPVIDVEIEVLHHLIHQVRRLEVDDFVVDIDSRLAESEVREGGTDVSSHRPALRIFLDED